MKAWFMALSERERYLLLGAATFFLLLLLWLYAWRPLKAYQASLKADMVASIEDKQYLQQAQQQVDFLAQLETAKPVDTTTSVQLLVNPLLKRFKLDRPGILVRADAKSRNAVSLKLEGAQFDQLARLLSTLEKQHKIYVSSMALIPNKAPGLTGAQITLER